MEPFCFDLKIRHMKKLCKTWSRKTQTNIDLFIHNYYIFENFLIFFIELYLLKANFLS